MLQVLFSAVSMISVQEIDHVHFHVIPKPSPSHEDGLVIGWPAKPMDKDELQKVFEDVKGKL
jgi:diadenosine tetraphosphate (Ap4A) HIT family hydrolase